MNCCCCNTPTHLLLLLAVVLALADPLPATSSTVSDRGKGGCVILSQTSYEAEAPKINLYWHTSVNEGLIRFKVVAVGGHIGGYLAFGFSDPDKGFFNGVSDVFVAVPPSPYCPNGCIEDAWFNKMKLRKDKNGNADLIDPVVNVHKNAEGEEVFEAEFSRRFDTGDADEDVAVNVATRKGQMVLWAYRNEAAGTTGWERKKPTDMAVIDNAVDFLQNDNYCGAGAAGAGIVANEKEELKKKRAALAVEELTGKGTFYSDSTNAAGLFQLDWELVDQQTMKFTMTARTTSQYLSFGFRPMGVSANLNMNSCDMYVAWINGNAFYISDAWSRSNGRPSDDVRRGGVNNILSPSHSRNSTHTIVSFQRKLVTGDTYDYPITNSTVTVLWALGEFDSGTWAPGQSLLIGEHPNGYYGGGSARFIDPPPRPAGNCTVAPRSGSYRSVNGIMQIEWELTADNQSMKFNMTARTQGWASMGINTACSMSGADQVTGWVSGSSVTLFDAWATGYAVPSLDTARGGTNDVVNAAGWKNSTHTFLSWTKKLNTGDANDYALIDKWYTMMWAVGTSVGSSPTSYAQHGGSGTGWDCTDVNFIGCSSSPPVVTTVSSSSSSYAAPAPQPQGNCTGYSGTYAATDMEVAWNISSDLKSVTFRMTGKTTGWISIGWNGAYAMNGADMIVGWVSGSTVTVFDTFSTGRSIPICDTASGGLNSITGVSGWENSTHTSITFTRLLNTNDSKDYTITQSALWLVWAMASTDGTDCTSFIQHDMGFGGAQVNLFTCSGSAVIPTTTPSSSSVASGSATPGNCGYYSARGGDFVAKWNISQDRQSITFELAGRTQGWVSIGFNSANAMKRADKVTGWVSGTQVSLFDTYCTGHVIPVCDTTRSGGVDSLSAVSGYQNSTHTVLRFTRLLNTGDPNDYVIGDSSIYLLWAMGSRDGSSCSNYIEHDQGFGGDLVNFLQCGSTSGITNGWLENPGQGIVLTTGAAILVAALVFWSRRAAGKAVPYDPLPSGARNGLRMQGSQIAPIEDAGEEVELGETPMAMSSSTIVAEDTASIKGESNAWNTISGLLNYRVRGDATIWSFILAILYVSMNAAWVVSWGYVRYTSPKIETWARITGHLVSANMFVAMLPATRNSILVILTGESFERTIMFHRWVGRWTLFVLLVHTVLFFIARGFEIISDGTVIIGLIGLAACLVVVVTSIEPIRRKFFNVFYYLHFAFVIFFVAALIHTGSFILFFILSAVVYGIDRALRLVWGTIPRQVVEFSLLPEGLMRVRWPKNTLGRYLSAQYIFINFPQLSLLEWHPFSLSSGPKEDLLEVNIKSLGNYTEKLVAKLPSKGKLWIRADGPYGRLMVPERTTRSQSLSQPVLV